MNMYSVCINRSVNSGTQFVRGPWGLQQTVDFHNYVHMIYPNELKIKDTTKSDASA
jgi:hypothetical protein